jgi:hypothetical protein
MFSYEAWDSYTGDYEVYHILECYAMCKWEPAHKDEILGTTFILFCESYLLSMKLNYRFVWLSAV